MVVFITVLSVVVFSLSIIGVNDRDTTNVDNQCSKYDISLWSKCDIVDKPWLVMKDIKNYMMLRQRLCFVCRKEWCGNKGIEVPYEFLSYCVNCPIHYCNALDSEYETLLDSMDNDDDDCQLMKKRSEPIDPSCDIWEGPGPVDFSCDMWEGPEPYYYDCGDLCDL